MAFMDTQWGIRKDAGSKHLAKLLTTVLFVAVMFLLVDSVASSSRVLPNLPESDIHSTAPITPVRLGSFAALRTMIQRNLLQDLPFKPPSSPGGSPPQSGIPNKGPP